MAPLSHWNLGTIKLSDIVIVGEPGLSYLLGFNSEGVLDPSKYDVQQAQGILEPEIEVRLRTCQSGEAYLLSGECEVCPAGTYLFGSHSTPQNCLVCPINAYCFGGEEIGPIQGFWRADRFSLSFLPCFNPAACLGSFRPTLN